MVFANFNPPTYHKNAKTEWNSGGCHKTRPNG